MSVILVHNISLSYWYYREERRGSQSSTVYKYKIWAVWIYPPEVCCCFQFEMIVDLLILCSLSGLLFISHPHCLSILHWHWLCRVIMVISEFEKHFYRCCLLHDVWCHCHKYQKKKNYLQDAEWNHQYWCCETRAVQLQKMQRLAGDKP